MANNILTDKQTFFKCLYVLEAEPRIFFLLLGISCKPCSRSFSGSVGILAVEPPEESVVVVLLGTLAFIGEVQLLDPFS